MNCVGRNFLGEQAWGRFPRSRRRRRVALQSFLTRMLVYASLLAVIATIFAIFFIKTQGRIDDDIYGIILYIGLFIGAWFCAAAPFQVENKFSSARQLLANQHDYRLAGMTGRDMLKGIAAPQLAGSKLFALVHFVTVASLFACDLSIRNTWPRGMRMLIIVMPMTILITAVFNAIAGTRFNIAQWRYPSRGFRSLKTACFVFSSPFTVLVCCPFLARFSSRSTIETLIFTEIALLVIRGSWAAAEWRKAERWLDGDENTQSRKVHPAEAHVKPDEEILNSRI